MEQKKIEANKEDKLKFVCPGCKTQYRLPGRCEKCGGLIEAESKIKEKQGNRKVVKNGIAPAKVWEPSTEPGKRIGRERKRRG